MFLSGTPPARSRSRRWTAGDTLSGSIVYASRDYGTSWQPIAGDLPRGEVARTIAENIKNPDRLYLGIETGLFVTFDRGARWRRLRVNLPTVPIYEITLHPRDNAMLLATHGRSIGILDDLTPLQEFTRAQPADAYMFTPGPVVQRKESDDRMKSFEGDRQFLGKNPDRGIAITYHLKSPAKEVSLLVTDSSGKGVRELKGAHVKDKTEAGINRLVWDLQVEPLPRPEGREAGGGGGFGGGGVDGPLVLPGEYRAALRVDGREAGSHSFNVRGDPQIQISDEDRRILFATSMKLHNLQKTANEGADSLSRANEQRAAVQKALKDTARVPEELRQRVDWATRI